jgi:hypothetical protein
MQDYKFPEYNLSQLIPGFDALINKNNADECGVLKATKTTIDGTDYRVIKYDKDMLSLELIGTYGLCRSIVVDSNNKLISFAPPKSIPYGVFSNMYANNYSHPLIAQEFVEGTMINVFWDDTRNIWEITTRSTIGASSSFYKPSKNMTFRNMFYEAVAENKMDLSLLDRGMCYSFVLQHPDNRIVVPFKSAQLYLVAAYSIDNTCEKICVKAHDIYNIHTCDAFSSTTVNVPRKYEWSTYDELVKQFGSLNTPFRQLGVVIYNMETGERTKIRNPVYERVRHLRGNQPKIQYHYLILRKEGKVGEFLKYYPENNSTFSGFRDQVHEFTNALFKNYVSCYIKKERPLLEFSPQFRTHMFNLHQIYTTQLKEKKQFVTKLVVINYVNDVHPTLLMHSLNYNPLLGKVSAKQEQQVEQDS